jgi:RNA polymerase sigma-70 factor (ECF subfamily)
MNTIHVWKMEEALLSGAMHQCEPAAAATVASFDQLVVDQQAYITRLVVRLVGWRSDVDDLVQEVFVAALGGWPRFRHDCSARTWLTRIALNKCRSYARRRWVRERLLTAWQAAHDPNAQLQSSQSCEHETAEQVRHAVAQLRPRDREVIVLHYLEQLSPHEAAKVLQISQNAVEVRLTRARKRLKQIISQETEP